MDFSTSSEMVLEVVREKEENETKTMLLPTDLAHLRSIEKKGSNLRWQTRKLRNAARVKPSRRVGVPHQQVPEVLA